MSNILRLSIVLAIVTVVAAFVLAEIYSVTKPQIELQKQAKTQEALKFVLPNAQLLTEVTRKVPIKDGDGVTLYEKEEVMYYRAFADAEGQQLLGYAFKADGNGYSSIIETMVGIDTLGTIKNIKIISQKETPGLGALAEDSNEFTGKKWSTQQFKGKTVDQMKVDKDGGEIVSITGATITSRTIANSIRDELKVLLPQIVPSQDQKAEEN
jgi:electron transport complex protein RnfG